MKTFITRLHLASLLGLGAAGVLLAATPLIASAAPADKRVEVIFDHPDKFTDVKGDSMDSSSGREDMLGQIRDFLETRGSALLPAGQKLTLTFTDIDLAGDYEPWHTGAMRDARVVKDIYPPRFVFTYKLTDASGAVVKEDKVNLTDLSFMSRVTIDRNDTLHFEKDMLADWMRSVVPRKK